MSREIDMTDPSKWTQEDKQYLSDRGRLPEDMALDMGAKTMADIGEQSPSTRRNTDYQSMTNDQLRSELAARGLETGGNKGALVGRLVEDDLPLDEREESTPQAEEPQSQPQMQTTKSVSRRG